MGFVSGFLVAQLRHTSKYAFQIVKLLPRNHIFYDIKSLSKAGSAQEILLPLHDGFALCWMSLKIVLQLRFCCMVCMPQFWTWISLSDIHIICYSSYGAFRNKQNKRNKQALAALWPGVNIKSRNMTGKKEITQCEAGANCTVIIYEKLYWGLQKCNCVTEVVSAFFRVQLMFPTIEIIVI